MESNLVKHWVKVKNSNDETTMRGYDLFGPGSDFIHEFAKAQLGINNRYDPVNVFDNPWEAIEGYIDYAKEKGLDSAIADKYDFHTGSGDPERIMEHPEEIYSEQDLNEISKFLKPKGFEDFKAALRSLPEAKQIQAEEKRIKNYQNGDALTKAFVLYDIAQKRLHSKHKGDERFFRKQRTWSRPDGSRGILTENQKTPSGATEGYKWVIKSDVAKELMHMIATSPITEKIPLIESKKSQSFEQGRIEIRTDIPESDIRLAERNAAQAIHDRIVTTSARYFSPEQESALKHYRALFTKDTPTKDLFMNLYASVINEADVKRCPKEWCESTKEELQEMADGIKRDHSLDLHR